MRSSYRYRMLTLTNLGKEGQNEKVEGFKNVKLIWTRYHFIPFTFFKDLSELIS